MAKLSAFEQAKNALQKIVSAPGNAVKKWWSTPVTHHLGGPAEQTQNTQNNAPVVNPTPSPWGIAPTPSPWPQEGQTPVATEGAAFNLQDVENRIRTGIQRYGAGSKDQGTVDFGQYIPQIVEAAQKYPFFRNNPYLLPQIAILETSAGRNVTRPNNLLNWGINYPGNNEAFSNMTPAQVLETAISGLGERSPYYKQFRDVNRPMTQEEVNQFAKIYEPGNAGYGSMLWNGMQSFGQ